MPGRAIPVEGMFDMIKNAAPSKEAAVRRMQTVAKATNLGWPSHDPARTAARSVRRLLSSAT